MSILLDTCVVSELIRPVPDAKVVAWTGRTPQDICFLSAITLGEVMQGIARLPAGRRRERLESWSEGLVARYESRVVPVDPAIARQWGALSGALLRRGTPTSMADGLIAATALVRGLSIATRNVADFSPFGVEIVNPWQS